MHGIGGGVASGLLYFLFTSMVPLFIQFHMFIMCCKLFHKKLNFKWGANAVDMKNEDWLQSTNEHLVIVEMNEMGMLMVDNHRIIKVDL